MNLSDAAYRMATWIQGGRPSEPSTAGLWGHRDTVTGIEMNENLALNCSTIWAANTIISSSLAVMPICMYERGDDGRHKVDDHYILDVIDGPPNPEMTNAVFRETLQSHALLWGNAYAEIEWSNAGKVKALWPITPNRIRPDRTTEGELVYMVRLPDGTEKPMLPEQVLHIPGLGFDGTQGYNVVKMARNSFGLTLAAELYGAAMFGNGGRPEGILTTDKKLSPEAVRNLRNSWNENHQGIARSHRVAIMHEGLTWQATSLNPEEAQFLSTREFQVTEIARWFNIPPHLLRDLSRATFSNIEQQGQDYVRHTLMPWMVKWEQELQRKLVPGRHDRRYYFEIDADYLLRADMLTRYKAYYVGRQAGFLNVDNILEWENMNPLPNGQGKHYLVPVNYQDIEQVEQAIEQGVSNDGNPNAAKSGGNPNGGNQ
jgi:HK97 family phage portal protein